MRVSFVFFSLLMFFSGLSQAKITEYNFDINYKTVNFTGSDIQAMSVGGSIPAPTIEATVGDILRVTFNNKMKVESSIHWHGVLLPNDQDGVPYLTTPPIGAGKSFTYEFPVTHHGTYWYHSHTGLQEQRGVYGSIVFHPKAGEKVQADHDAVVVLSDWSDENPNRIMHNLKKSDDYYALKKNSVQSWFKVTQHGWQVILNRLSGAWDRMGPMDISDVGYDAFLVNGKRTDEILSVKAGETLRLRIINAAASSYFNVEYAGGSMTIVAVDGVDVKSLIVDRQRIAIAETFDVLVTVPKNNAYEFRATSEDGTGHASIIIGKGPLVLAPSIPKPNSFLVNHSEHAKVSDVDYSTMGHIETNLSQMDHSQMSHSGIGQGVTKNVGEGNAKTNSSDVHDFHMKHNMAETNAGPQRMAEYESLRAVKPTRYSNGHPQRKVRLELTGDMERYAWSFNNKVLSEDSKILINKGEVVQFVLVNTTMMHHPVHLHGHFFRVLNGQGDYAPLKHTVNVPPMQTVVIEFLANEEKDWFFHCHNLYHMKSGMTRVVSYTNSTQSTPNSLAPLFSDRNWFYFADVGAQSNFTQGNLRAENTRNAFNLEYEWDYENENEYEVEIVYERYINRFLDLYAGIEVEQNKSNGKFEQESIGIVGAHYLLPLLIEANIQIDTKGHGRLQLGSELQLTNRLSFVWNANTDREYRMQLEYELSKQVVITGGRDDLFDWGAGLEVRF